MSLSFNSACIFITTAASWPQLHLVISQFLYCSMHFTFKMVLTLIANKMLSLWCLFPRFVYKEKYCVGPIHIVLLGSKIQGFVIPKFLRIYQMNADSVHLYIYDWLYPYPRHINVEAPCKQSTAQWHSLDAKKHFCTHCLK